MFDCYINLAESQPRNMVHFRLETMVLLILLACTQSSSEDRVGDGNSSRCYDDATTIHEFAPINIDGDPIELGTEYEDKVLLVINVASFCTFTEQYHGLTRLKNVADFADELEILAFPCNQFGYREPGENEYEIMNSLMYARPGYGYTPNFPIFEKIAVNGEDEIELFTHLKASCPPAKLEIGDKGDCFWSPIRNNDITWNFNKFLVDKEGVPYKRYDSAVEPEDLAEDIRALIGDTESERQRED